MGRLSEQLGGTRRRLTPISVANPKLNNGTHLGGLAYALQQGLAGYQTRQDDQAYDAAMDAYTSGLEGGSVVPEMGEMGPLRPKPGSTDAALSNLRGLSGNRYARSLSARLLEDRLEQQQRTEQAPRFETVQSPYRRGGVGQRNLTTGQIVGYQSPEKPDPVRPPKTRNRIDGANVIQEEFDDSTGQWSPIGKGPRFVPNATRDLLSQYLTPQQQGTADTLANSSGLSVLTPGDSGLPPGAAYVGTSNGVPVYQTPDGRRFMVD